MTLPSLQIVYDLASHSRDEMRANFEAADTKAGIILAFNGILIPLSKDIDNPYKGVGVALCVISAILAFFAYWPRKFPILDPDALRNHLTYEEEDARLKLGDTMLSMAKQSAGLISRKAKVLKMSLSLLIVAIMVFGVGVVATPNEKEGEKNNEQPKSTSTAQQSPAPRPGHPTASPAATATTG
ncbi:hypothetical protein ACIRQT_15710 [Streptomyces californicus]|uniref:hypothetical protein n=1 Tax=Streptomyces californicus TaxID=67351 RepID=UPI0038272C7E